MAVDLAGSHRWGRAGGSETVFGVPPTIASVPVASGRKRGSAGGLMPVGVLDFRRKMSGFTPVLPPRDGD